MKWNFFLFTLIALVGCRNKELTKSLESIYKYQDKRINLIIKEKTISGNRVTLVNTPTSLTSEYSDTGRYLSDHYKLFEKGDTVIKEVGQFYIKVIKKDKIYLISLDYYGKSILDSVLYR